MFRMKFQSRDTAGEDDDSSGVQERYGERTTDSVGCSPETVIFEGRVGKFGRIQRLSNPNKAVAQLDSSRRTLILSPNVATTGPKYCPDVDLEGPARDAEVPHHVITFDVDVLKELVKPLAESLHVKVQRSTKESLADKNVIVTYIHYQTSTKRQDVEMDSVSSRAPALLEARTDSGRSTSSSADSECRSSYADEGKPTCEKENEAVTAMINKLSQKWKNKQPNGHDDRFAKPWEEPLLAAHDQAKLNLIAKEEAKVEAKRLAEEERRNCERQQRELRDLANCVSTATTPGGSFARKSKLRKILRLLENPFRVFRAQKIKHDGYPIDREGKVLNPNARLFSGCRTVPSGPTDSEIMMRNTSRKSISALNIQFGKVESTNRDVPAWTRNEYLRRNGRIPERSNDTEEEEEFGGVLGNNYLNNSLDDGMTGAVVSDYDSDSD